jgi:hypothetical protein
LRAPNAGPSGWRKILYFSVKTLRREIAKVLKSTEEAHKKTMSIFGADEHLRGKSVLTSVFEGDGSLDDDD